MSYTYADLEKALRIMCGHKIPGEMIIDLELAQYELARQFQMFLEKWKNFERIGDAN